MKEKMTAHLYADGGDPVKGRTDEIRRKKEFQRKEPGCVPSHKED